jgi:hypothetical protein
VFVTGLGAVAFAAALAAPALSALPAPFGSLLPRVASVAATGAAFGGAFTGVPEETELIDAIYIPLIRCYTNHLPLHWSSGLVWRNFAFTLTWYIGRVSATLRLNPKLF